MYNRFFTTALCSPTRAALLTGRNHHTAGTGVIIEMGTGFPGYTGINPQSTALVSKHCREMVMLRPDETIKWIGNANAGNPNKPWFLYYSSPAAHAPHHAPKEWRDKFKGKFDQGWDRLREETYERQKRSGIIPANTQLTARPAEIPSWDSQSDDAKKCIAG
jgi:arylsulfatase A-like enzyme